jgi:hypothetical protein
MALSAVFAFSKVSASFESAVSNNRVMLNRSWCVSLENNKNSNEIGQISVSLHMNGGGKNTIFTRFSATFTSPTLVRSKMSRNYCMSILNENFVTLHNVISHDELLLNWVFAFCELTVRIELVDPYVGLVSSVDDHLNFNMLLVMGNAVIPANRSVLSAHSPVFKAMLESGMVEDRHSKISITDFSESTVRHLVNSLMSGHVHCDSLSTPELLIIADKYQCAKLKSQCEIFLVKRLSTSSAIKWLKLGDLHSCAYLKPAALRFIANNEALLTSQNIAEQLGSALANELINFIAKNKLFPKVDVPMVGRYARVYGDWRDRFY